MQGNTLYVRACCKSRADTFGVRLFNGNFIFSLCPWFWPLQISKAAAAHERVSKQLADTEEALSARTEQLSKAAASLEAKEAELDRLSQQHQALIVQHERTEGELSDLTGVLKAKQTDNEALQQRWPSPHSQSAVVPQNQWTNHHQLAPSSAVLLSDAGISQLHASRVKDLDIL